MARQDVTRLQQLHLNRQASTVPMVLTTIIRRLPFFPIRMDSQLAQLSNFSHIRLISLQREPIKAWEMNFRHHMQTEIFKVLIPDSLEFKEVLSSNEAALLQKKMRCHLCWASILICNKYTTKCRI